MDMTTALVSSDSPRPLGLLGGAFDPVHIGHLRGAIAVREELQLERVDFIPAAQSPLKGGAALTAEHRLAMLQLAVRDVPGLDVDARELERPGPSYTVDTLKALRAEYGAARPLLWMVGSDILTTLSQWSRWRELLDHAHLVVMARPGASDPEDVVKKWIASHRIEGNVAVTQPAGGVVLVRQPLLDIASSQIRTLIAEGRDTRFLMPNAVMEYIERHTLFIRDNACQ
jgi:nicotinate-nucleotide adenylyltransferase